MSLRNVLIGCGVVLAILAVGGCSIAIVSAIPYGVHPDIDFRGAEISAARGSLAGALEADLDGVERRSGFAPVGGRARHDSCDAGQYDFAKEDPYAYVCRIRIYQALALPEPFAENASRLGEALVEGTCPHGTETDLALTRPYDSPQDLWRTSGDCVGGRELGGPRIIGWLPARPSPAELKHARLRFSHACLSSFRREHCEVEPLDLRELIAYAQSGASDLAIVIAEDTYYNVPWDCPWPASMLRASCQA
jgi:hypothetical protein